MPPVPRATLIIAAAAIAIVGCQIGVRYSVGGTVTGLTGQGLVLADNAGDDLVIGSNGSFVFTKGITNNDTYSVTVATQPSNPAQTCTVQNGSGTIDKADVGNVIVSCQQAGHYAYVANQLSNNLSAYSIDAAGFLTPAPASRLRSRVPTRYRWPSIPTVGFSMSQTTARTTSRSLPSTAPRGRSPRPACPARRAAAPRR